MRRAAVLGAVGVGGGGLWRDIVLKIPGFLLRTCEPFLCMWLPDMALSQLSGEIRFREKTSKQSHDPRFTQGEHSGNYTRQVQASCLHTFPSRAVLAGLHPTQPPS